MFAVVSEKKKRIFQYRELLHFVLPSDFFEKDKLIIYDQKAVYLDVNSRILLCLVQLHYGKPTKNELLQLDGDLEKREFVEGIFKFAVK